MTKIRRKKNREKYARHKNTATKKKQLHFQKAIEAIQQTHPHIHFFSLIHPTVSKIKGNSLNDNNNNKKNEDNVTEPFNEFTIITLAYQMEPYLHLHRI